MKHTEYEVFATYGDSDLIVAETLDEAISEAERLSMLWVDTDISIVKVEREVVKHFRHGSEVA